MTQDGMGVVRTNVGPELLRSMGEELVDVSGRMEPPEQATPSTDFPPGCPSLRTLHCELRTGVATQGHGRPLDSDMPAVIDRLGFGGPHTAESRSDLIV